MLGVRLLTALLIAPVVATCVRGALAGQATASPSPSPSAETLTLRLGWTESPLNPNPFIGYSDPGDSAACFTADQIEAHEMNWSCAECDRLTEEQYCGMDPVARMELL